MRLIDADKLKQVIHSSNLSGNREWLLMELDKIIDNAPTVDLTKGQAYDKGFITAMKLYARPQGKWEAVGFVNMKYAWCRCSICHRTTKIYLDSSNVFCCLADIRKKAISCLYCGADMRGDKDDNNL